MTTAHARCDATGQFRGSGIRLAPEQWSYALVAGRHRFRPLLSPLSTSGGDPQLRRPGNADGQDQECADQGCSKERNRHRHLAVCTKELDPHRAGVLDNEVDQCDAQDGGDRHGYPSSSDASMPNSVAAPLSTTTLCAGSLPGLALDGLVVPVLRFDDGHAYALPN
jgi:hypothetical protein